jgi:hypothetical protein
VQVVLGEGEPGLLRLVLEAQGFQVVGHARGDDELRRVIAVTHPSVIVLDAGISALAAIDAQVRADGAPIVVVWPKDVFTPVAEERVEPATALLELGNAVRRVVERHAVEQPVRIPDADQPDTIEPIAAAPLPASTLPSQPGRFGRRRHVLVAAAAWTIALTALATIGLAVPSALRVFEHAGTLHPFVERPERALTSDREGPGRPSTEARQEPSCPERRPVGPRPGRARSDEPGRGCDRGKHVGIGEPRNGRGRPDDPGPGSGRGNGGSQGEGSSEKASGGGSKGDRAGGEGGDQEGTGNGDGGGDGDQDDAGNGGDQGQTGQGGQGGHTKNDGPAGRTDREKGPASQDRGKGSGD